MQLIETPFSVQVREPEGVLSFTRDDMIKYAGIDNLIASGVTMRLLSRAFRDLAIDAVPNRRELYFLSAFAGAGVRDCIELVTRAWTEGRYILDKDAATVPATPLGGAMYYEVAYRDRAFAYTFSEEIFDKNWCDLVASYQEGAANRKDHADYIAYKFSILGRILSDPKVFAEIRACDPDVLRERCAKLKG